MREEARHLVWVIEIEHKQPYLGRQDYVPAGRTQAHAAHGLVHVDNGMLPDGAWRR